VTWSKDLRRGFEQISAPAKVTLAVVGACRINLFHHGAGDRGLERVGVALAPQICIGMSTEHRRGEYSGGRPRKEVGQLDRLSISGASIASRFLFPFRDNRLFDVLRPNLPSSLSRQNSVS